jgi:hypothetical protein
MRIPAALRSHRWFGVPRWICLAGVVGLVGFALVYGPWNQPSAQVRTIVAGLRSSSVYQEAGAPTVLDAARTRQIIGNRPIVVAILSKTPLPPSDDDDARFALCEQIADQVPTDYVWVYAANDGGKYQGSNCYGPKFPTPTKKGVDVDEFDTAVNVAAQLSAQYRMTDTDFMPQIEEFVLSFDSEAATDYGAVPTRSAVPDELAGQQVVLACAAMVLGTVAFFLLLRLGGLALRRRSATTAALRRRHTELTTRLSSIADTVINPREPKTAKEAQRQADVAKRYVFALDELEHARSDHDLTKAEGTITTLAKEVVG